MLDALMAKVRADGVRVRTLTVRVRYPDLSHATHGRSLAAATDLEAPFSPLIAPLLRAAWTKRQPLRLVGVRLSGVGEGADQLELFAEGDERRRRLAGAVDRLNRASPGAVVTHGHQLSPADRKIGQM
jgi:DNA polymerase-4